MTVAKMEMQAAVFGVRLREPILEEHDIEVNRFIHWTDSTTVLHWLHASNNKQPVFVANRNAETLENSTTDQWQHVEGKLNPADIGTREMTVEALKESEWLTGPAWLTETETPGLRRLKSYNLAFEKSLNQSRKLRYWN